LLWLKEIRIVVIRADHSDRRNGTRRWRWRPGGDHDSLLAGACSRELCLQGAAKLLKRIGAILGGNLPSHKARLKLMLLLAIGADMERVRRSFEACSAEPYAAP
jgi:hypothetical protein